MKKLVKFPEVLFFQEGPGVRNTQYTSEGVKLLNVANLVDGRVDLSTSDRFISRHEAYGKYKHFLCDDGDFIIASSGIKVEYVDKKMGFVDESMLPLCMNTSTIRFKVLNNKELNIRYFMYYLKSKHFKAQLGKHITGSAQLNYGPSHLKDMTLPVTDISIQNNIVNILDKIQNIINISEIMLEKLDKLVKARFVEMFGIPDLNSMGWEESFLSEKLDVLGGYAFKSDEFDVEIGIPVLRIGNINAGYFRTVNMVYWHEDPNLERYAMYPGDLVMSLTGTVGKDDYGNVCILGNDYDKYYLNQRNAKLEIKEGLDKLYLSEILKFEAIKKRLTGINRGVRQANISNRDILNLCIPVPPIHKQNQFATFVEQVNKSKFLNLHNHKSIYTKPQLCCKMVIVNDFLNTKRF